MNAIDFDLAQEEAAKEQEGVRIATEEHFEKLYTDEKALIELSKSPRNKQADLYSDDPKGDLLAGLNYAYLSTLAGRDLSPTEYQLVRDQYSAEQFGTKSATESEFFTGVQGQYQTQQKRRLAANELYTAAVKQTLDDEVEGKRTSGVDAFQKWTDKNQDLFNADEYLDLFVSRRGVVQQAKEDMEAVAPQAARVWQSLMRYNNEEASEQDILALGTELVAMPREARDKVFRYAAIAAQASGEGMAPIEQAARNFEKSIARSFGGVAGGLKAEREGQPLPFGIVPVGEGVAYTPPLDLIERMARTRIMQLEREPDSPAKAEEMARLKQIPEMSNVVRDLKHLAQTGIDPIKPVFPEGKFLSLGTAERGLYGAAGSLGYMVAAGINPMLGLAVVYDSEYNELRRENPDLDPHAASLAALVSGSIQTVIERAQLRTFGAIGTALQNIRKGVVRAAIGTSYGLAKENVQEGIQDAVSAGIPLIMSHLRNDMPDQNGAKVMQDYLKQRGEVAFATFFTALPFGIIAAGGAKFQNIDNNLLPYWGFSPDQRRRIVSSRDPDAALRAETPLRTKKSIGDGIAQLQSDLDAARAAQNDPDLPTLESSVLADGAREWRVVRNPQGEAQQGPQYLSNEELRGKTVTLNTLDTKTGQVQQLSMDAAAGQTIVRRNIDSFSKLVDCLLR